MSSDRFICGVRAEVKFLQGADTISMNNAIQEFKNLCTVDDRYYDHKDHGRSIPYIGWGWENVYFADDIWFGYINDHNYTGFMNHHRKTGCNSFKLISSEHDQVVNSLEKMCEFWLDRNQSIDFHPEFNEMLISFGSLVDSIGENHK